MRKHWQNQSNLVLGLWVFISPWILQHATATGAGPLSAATNSIALWNLHIIGIAVSVLAMAALIAFRDWQEWTNMALGFWLYVSPWALGFSASVLLMWNAVIVGTLIVVLAGWTMAPPRGGASHA